MPIAHDRLRARAADRPGSRQEAFQVLGHGRGGKDVVRGLVNAIEVFLDQWKRVEPGQVRSLQIRPGREEQGAYTVAPAHE